MNLQNIFLYLFSLFIASCSSSEISWDKDSVDAELGGDFTATCTVKDADMFSVIRLDHVRDNHVTTISDNQFLKNLFKGLKRYKLDYATEDDETRLTLTLTGVKSRDVGVIRCYDLANEENKELFSIRVLTPIDKVYFFLSKPGSTPDEDVELVAEDGKISLEPDAGEDAVGLLGCRARAESPIVTAKLEGPKDDPVFNHVEVAQLKEEDSKEVDLPSTMYTSRVTFSSLTSKFNGVEIKCTAKMEGAQDQQISTVVNLQYRPDGKCVPSVAEAGKFSVDCVVESNPAFQVVVNDDDENDVPDAQITQKALGGDKVNAKISNLDSSKKYTVLLSNHVGIFTVEGLEARLANDAVEEEKVVEKVVAKNEKSVFGSNDPNKMAVSAELNNGVSSQLRNYYVFVWSCSLLLLLRIIFATTF